jgi:hypothetical protein
MHRSGDVDPEAAILADEQYAIMLQEELFLAELAANPEFLRAVEADERRAMGLPPRRGSESGGGGSGSGSGSGNGSEGGGGSGGSGGGGSGAATTPPGPLRQRLAGVGAATRRQLTVLWRRFKGEPAPPQGSDAFYSGLATDDPEDSELVDSRRRRKKDE